MAFKLLSKRRHSISRRFVLKGKEKLVEKTFEPGSPVEFEDGKIAEWGQNLLKTYPKTYSEVKGRVASIPPTPPPVNPVDDESTVDDETVVKDEFPTKEDLMGKTVPQLRELADSLEIDKSVTKKEDLADAIVATYPKD